MKKKIQPKPADSTPHKIIYCELFMHQKHTAVCVVLRAKGVCRKNCGRFFNWAKANDKTVDTVLRKYDRPIKQFLHEKELPVSNLKAKVVPKGEHVCKHCFKPFQVEGRLKNHLKLRHRRELSKSLA